MTSTLRRAGGFATVGTLALAAPVLGTAAAVVFGAVAVGAFFTDEGPLFELFARHGDREDGRLNGLLGFALAAIGLALLATVPDMRMPVDIFVASVLILAYGNLGRELVRAFDSDPFRSAAGFTAAGAAAGFAGQAIASEVGGTVFDPPVAAFLATTGALVAALLRAVLYERDDPLAMLSIALALWLLAMIPTSITPLDLAIALGVTVALGYLSYALEIASVEGMLAGTLLGLLTIVFGGVGWFAVLISFFAVGGLASKFKYETKKERGVAQENEGARGSGNVLGNAAVALVAVVAYAAAARLPVDGTLFLFAFAGSVAAAMSDTLSSEIGGLFDNPRLITSLEPVDPGTDGGVTWQGELAGIAGAALVAALAAALMPLGRPLVGAGVVVLGGVVGMTVDSLLGATLEGGWVGNQTVNFVATLSGAVASIAGALVAL